MYDIQDRNRGRDESNPLETGTKGFATMLGYAVRWCTDTKALSLPAVAFLLFKLQIFSITRGGHSQSKYSQYPPMSDHVVPAKGMSHNKHYPTVISTYRLGEILTPRLRQSTSSDQQTDSEALSPHTSLHNLHQLFSHNAALQE